MSPRPLGGVGLDRSMKALRAAGATVVASMLTDGEISDFGLARQEDACALCGIEYLRFPIVDHSVPADREAAVAFARTLLSRLEGGDAVVVHCFAGIGRSGLMAAATMFLAGFEVADACARLSAARGIPIPETREQRAWLDALRS